MENKMPEYRYGCYFNPHTGEEDWVDLYTVDRISLCNMRVYKVNTGLKQREETWINFSMHFNRIKEVIELTAIYHKGITHCVSEAIPMGIKQISDNIAEMVYANKSLDDAPYMIACKIKAIESLSYRLKRLDILLDVAELNKRFNISAKEYKNMSYKIEKMAYKKLRLFLHALSEAEIDYQFEEEFIEGSEAILLKGEYHFSEDIFPLKISVVFEEDLLNTCEIVFDTIVEQDKRKEILEYLNGLNRINQAWQYVLADYELKDPVSHERNGMFSELIVKASYLSEADDFNGYVFMGLLDSMIEELKENICVKIQEIMNEKLEGERKFTCNDLSSQYILFDDEACHEELREENPYFLKYGID